MSKRPQGKRDGRRERGFRTVTLVGPHGEILAYADRAAVSARTIGLSGVTCAASLTSQFPGRRIRQVTLLVAGRPRVRLTGFSLSSASGEQLLPGGVVACDSAIGTFQRLARLRRQK